ncbi:LysR family transcriptional regulator [Polyangium aurulentum]|uniref:LysR family transcriptional regulator n=1 Tax=Polyangium aurulentum TaxID=2567896 RepID=UPI00146C4836|nr:LysR family transcriptional regulator [Polyangium aurulentum]UQA58604.1 LysR family transcriptional regulator [Polyangium aurulentum]
MQDLSRGRWDDVRIFLEAHRQKSLGAAAARLGVDTSTVSRRLTAFERLLGVRLFERSREGLLPTRSAELVLAAAEAMEAAYRRIGRDASDVQAEAEGVVRLSVDPGMAEVFVAPALVRLRERYPKIDIELDASARTRDLTRREADLGLRSTQPRGADLVITKLAAARWIVATAPELAKTLGRVSTWAELSWITWDHDYASFPPALWIAKHAGMARVVLRTSSFSSQLAAAASGLGVGLFPMPFVRARELVAVRHSTALASSAEAWPTSEVWLVGHRALREVPRVAAVWEFLAAEMRRAAR